MKVLICGISGAIARKLALTLLEKGHQVAGIDVRPWRSAPPGVEVHTVDLRKRAAEDVFRKFRPNAVVHMATVTSLVVSGEERYRINLGGTQAVFEHCRAYDVEHCVFVGRHTYYGAGPDVALYHTENEPPHALGKFPELSDLVAADLFAANALWRLPQLCTSVLRICYTLGPSGQGTLGTFLRGRAVPMVFGFDPLFQFLHEDDVAQALLLTLEKRPRGVFNVAGPQPLPLTNVAREAGRMTIPLPEFALALALGRGGLPSLSSGAVQHLKYPVVIDAKVFKKAVGFDHRYDELETIRDFARAFPSGGQTGTHGMTS
ncbi:MAG: SDR family oxidoreductase [Deltaproteobacteria bacterium]|nr:SDR family oxidoreductase [Deltaproteobacteria bacterium]